MHKGRNAKQMMTEYHGRYYNNLDQSLDHILEILVTFHQFVCGHLCPAKLHYGLYTV